MCSSFDYTQYLYILSMKKYNKTSSILPLSDFIKSRLRVVSSELVQKKKRKKIIIGALSITL